MLARLLLAALVAAACAPAQLPPTASPAAELGPARRTAAPAAHRRHVGRLGPPFGATQSARHVVGDEITTAFLFDR
jgi:hypothetical protein